MLNLTINEIALMAQVSKGTVSKVLNNYPGINEKTRERVLKIVKQHDFAPNSAAQALAFRRTGNIGLIIPHSPLYAMHDSFWASLVMSITTEVIASGFNLVLHLPQQEGSMEELFKAILRKKQLDGLIIGAELLDKNYLASLIRNDTPFVLLGQNPGFNHYAVDVDNRHAGERICQYLLDQGYRRIAMVTGPAQFYHYTDRANGYLDALAAAGNPFQHIVNVVHDDSHAMEDAVSELISEQKPDAIICGSGSEFMFDCLTACHNHNFDIPRNGFATFDDYRHFDFMRPGITAVSQPFLEIGQATVQLLVSLIKGQKPEDELVILKTGIVPRESCGESRT